MGSDAERSAGAAAEPVRDRALTLELAPLVEQLVEEGAVAPADAPALRRLAHALRAHFHHDFLAVKSRLRQAWEQLEGRDGKACATTGDQRELAKDVLATLRKLLARANFTDVPIEELHEAMRRHSSFGLKIELDLGDFVDLAAWRRRESTRREERRLWFGLRRRTAVVPIYDRVCIFARFKGSERFAEKKSLEGKLGARPGGVSLRLYRDVPKHDVEALFPGVKVGMRTFDRALLGVPAAAGALQILNLKLLGSLYALLLAVLVLLGLRTGDATLGARGLGELAGVAVLVTFLFRQWARFLGRKNLLHRQLAEHLQTCTLDSGFGVLLHLLDDAEAEEAVEVLLAYAFLRGSGGALAPAALDARVEEWLRQRLGLAVDFEEDDAVAKLRRLGLAEQGGADALRAVEPEAALRELERRWVERFSGR
ncbi:MAG: DUF3754 domain-containing protein [Planctomycetes bacterium]|nr:DUF3754 domain-containing protein [Planctomycetota bacterium]